MYDAVPGLCQCGPSSNLGSNNTNFLSWELSICMPTALSVRQPWAELILRGRKTIEVRTWSTHHRGELWLHAGIQADRDALDRFRLTTKKLVFGAIVGRCELYDCVEFTVDSWERWQSHHLNVGPLNKRLYAWFLRNTSRVRPMPLKGRLGLMSFEYTSFSE